MGKASAFRSGRRYFRTVAETAHRAEKAARPRGFALRSGSGAEGRRPARDSVRRKSMKLLNLVRRWAQQVSILKEPEYGDECPRGPRRQPGPPGGPAGLSHRVSRPRDEQLPGLRTHPLVYRSNHGGMRLLRDGVAARKRAVDRRRPDHPHGTALAV